MRKISGDDAEINYRFLVQCYGKSVYFCDVCGQLSIQRITDISTPLMATSLDLDMQNDSNLEMIYELYYLMAHT